MLIHSRQCIVFQVPVNSIQDSEMKPKPILVQDKQCNSETNSLASITDALPKPGILRSTESGIHRSGGTSTRGGSVKLTFGRRPMIKKRVTLR